MKIIKNYLTKNRCYITGAKRTPIGIQIHTIGTGQGTAQSVADYWNQSAVSACVTYCVDADVAGKVLQFLPENTRSWADAGWGNNSLITIEICESDYIKYKGGASYDVLDAAKFKADIMRGYETAVELCADICTRYGWDPQAKLKNRMYLISSHLEGNLAGLSSNHGDPDHVWARFGLTMDEFRADVAAAMSPPEFTKGAKYKMNIGLALRKSPSRNAPFVMYRDIPLTKRHLFRNGAKGQAIIKKGVKVKCLGEKKVGKRGVYMQIARGWVLAKYRGKSRVTKV